MSIDARQRLSVDLDAPMRAAVERRATKDDRTRGAVVREALRSYLTVDDYGEGE